MRGSWTGKAVREGKASVGSSCSRIAFLARWRREWRTGHSLRFVQPRFLCLPEDRYGLSRRSTMAFTARI